MENITIPKKKYLELLEYQLSWCRLQLHLGRRVYDEGEMTNIIIKTKIQIDELSQNKLY